MIWIILVILFVLAVGYSAMCFNTIKPNEMGIKVFMGNPNKKAGVLGPGFHFVWWPFEKIVRYTKERMLYKFQTGTVITKKGSVKGYDEMDPAELVIDCVFYATFDQSNLFTTLEHAPGSTAKQLGPFLVPYVMDIVRALCGRIPWRLINQERHDFAQWIIAHLAGNKGIESFMDIGLDDEDNIGFNIKGELPTQEELKKISPFLIFGLKDISFSIVSISFKDPEMRLAVSAPEKAKLNKVAVITQAEGKMEATILKAEGNSEKIRLEGKASADARRMMIEVIKDTPDLEVLYTLREMAQGKSNTFIYQLPKFFEDRIKNISGDNSTEDLIKQLSSQDREKVVDYIANLINEGKHK